MTRSHPIYRTLFVLLLALMAGSCENEVDINAPKKDITAAYGILDGSDSLHYIKVNQAFLPEGSAIQYAGENYEKTVYENISVSVLELEESGDVKRSFSLKDTVLEKEDGLFQSDEMQTLYYFTSTDLSADHRYKLQILINEGEEDEKKVTGDCELVGDFGITSHNTQVQFGGEFYLYGGGKYNDNFSISWNSIDNAALISLTMKIRIQEIMDNGDTVPRTLEWRAGNTEGSNDEMKIGGKGFYRVLGNSLEPGGQAGVQKRRFQRIDLQITAEEEEIRTYSNVAGASGSIVQHRPEYSNLEPEAVGIFGSVRDKEFIGFKLSQPSLDHLIEGEMTVDLDFEQ